MIKFNYSFKSIPGLFEFFFLIIDKHINDKDKEEANKRFLEIQDAYETLSNDQERAWYDSHREIIINGGVPGEADSTNFLFNIYPFFSSSCFKGFGDDEKVIFSIN
jgi:DnaJ family protein A protein 5